MRRQSLRRIVIFVLIGDGLLTVVFGRGYVAWLRDVGPGWVRPLTRIFLAVPEWLLRFGASLQIVLAVRMASGSRSQPDRCERRL
jgi:hypothetical protein